MSINYLVRFRISYQDLGNFIENPYTRKVSSLESQLSFIRAHPKPKPALNPTNSLPSPPLIEAGRVRSPFISNPLPSLVPPQSKIKHIISRLVTWIVYPIVTLVVQLLLCVHMRICVRVHKMLERKVNNDYFVNS